MSSHRVDGKMHSLEKRNFHFNKILCCNFLSLFFLQVIGLRGQYFRLFQNVRQKSHTIVSDCSLYIVNHLMGMPELFFQSSLFCRNLYRRQICSQLKCSTAKSSSHLNRKICLNSESPIVMFWIRWKFLLSSFLKTSGFRIKWFESILEQEGCPYLTWHLSKSPFSIQDRMSREALVL